MSELEADEYRPSSKLWRWTSHWDGDRGFYKMGRVTASVSARDGDAWPTWVIQVDGVVVREGSHEYVDGCERAVEDWLVETGRLVRDGS